MDQPQQPNPAKDFHISFNLALGLIHCANSTVRIASRIPGTTGTWYLGIYFFIGVLIQFFFYELCEASAIPDQVPPTMVIGMSLVAFSLHGMIGSWHRFHGVPFHSYEPGLAILSKRFRALPLLSRNFSFAEENDRLISEPSKVTDNVEVAL